MKEDAHDLFDLLLTFVDDQCTPTQLVMVNEWIIETAMQIDDVYLYRSIEEVKAAALDLFPELKSE